MAASAESRRKAISWGERPSIPRRCLCGNGEDIKVVPIGPRSSGDNRRRAVCGLAHRKAIDDRAGNARGVQPVAPLWRRQPFRGRPADQLGRTPASPIRCGRSFRSSAPSGARTRRANSRRLANRNTPELERYDAKGERIDQVTFHPAYHALMRRSMLAGLHCSRFDRGEDEAGLRHRARAVRALHDGADRVRAPLPDDHDQRLARDR